MRCPACDARNPDDATWCGQCFAPLGMPAAAETAASPAEAPAAGPGPEDRSHTRPAAAGSDRPELRRQGDAVEWRCPTCETWNPIDDDRCMSCGRTFVSGFDAPAPHDAATTAPVSETTVVLLSALLPGAGHIAAGRVATGIARALTYVVWLVGGVLLLREASGTGASVLPAAPLLVGALVVWGLSGVDALHLARHEHRELLGPRTLLWLVVGVVGATTVSFLVAALGVAAR